MKTIKKSVGGFTLLEVLVAILVLSFGLLGISGLLLATVQNNTIAAQRTTATFLAQDMADRIRGNVNATKQSNAGGTATQTVYYLSTVGSPRGCYGPGPTGNCATRQDVAERDMAEWVAQIRNSLPAGEGIVCKDATPDDGFSFAFPNCDANDSQSPWVIKIFWVVRAEDSSQGSPKVQRFSLLLGAT